MNEYLSLDGLCKVYVDPSPNGTIKVVVLSNNKYVEFIPTAEDKADIIAHIVPGFYYGNLMKKIADAITRIISN